MNTIMRITVITLLLFGLLSVDFVGLGFSETAEVVPDMLLLVAMVDTFILAYTINRSRWQGWRLIVAVFIIFYSLTTFLVGIETLYLGDILPPEQVYKLLFNSLIVAAIFSPLAVLMLGRLTISIPRIPRSGQQIAISWRLWPVKLALLAVVWVILFVSFGILVFTPLVNALDPTALDFYTDLEMPDWILLFQAGRGVALACLALLILSLVSGRRWQVELTVGLLLAWLMSANLLLATGLPTALRAAHFVEVFAENFIFSWIVAFLFLRRHEGLKRKEYPKVIEEKVGQESDRERLAAF